MSAERDLRASDLDNVPGAESSSIPMLCAELSAAAEAVASASWADTDANETLVAMKELAIAHRLVEAALVEAAERAERTQAASLEEWASSKDLLTHLLGGHRGAGAGFVRLAENTRGLRAVREALARGEISAAHARVIGRRVGTLPDVEGLRDRATQILLHRAHEGGLNATDLDRGFSTVVDEIDPDRRHIDDDTRRERNERAVHHSRYLSFRPDEAGGVHVRGYATAEDVELVMSCLMPLAAPQTTEPGACGGKPRKPGDPRLRHRDSEGRLVPSGCPDPRCFHDGTDPRDSGARLWDALIEGCRRLQASNELPMSHGVAARIVVTMPLDDLEGRVGGRGLLPSGESLSVSAVRRLACDAEVIPAVLGSRGEILDVGRAQRSVTPGMWTALVLRDRCCAFPGCDRAPIACDAHHVRHWADGGTTSLDNLVLLCRRHHTTVHRTPWTVHIGDGGRPEWLPPPVGDDRDRFTYRPGAGGGDVHDAA